MIEIDFALFVPLLVFAMLGLLLLWAHFLNWVFKRGRMHKEKEEKLQEMMDKILEKLKEK